MKIADKRDRLPEDDQTLDTPITCKSLGGDNKAGRLGDRVGTYDAGTLNAQAQAYGSELIEGYAPSMDPAADELLTLLKPR